MGKCGKNKEKGREIKKGPKDLTPIKSRKIFLNPDSDSSLPLKACFFS
jgi:hypothetical protein